MVPDPGAAVALYRLNNSGDEKSKRQRPENLPEHGERHAQCMKQSMSDVRHLGYFRASRTISQINNRTRPIPNTHPKIHIQQPPIISALLSIFRHWHLFRRLVWLVLLWRFVLVRHHSMHAFHISHPAHAHVHVAVHEVQRLLGLI
jgi:hypothetical protein